MKYLTLVASVFLLYCSSNEAKKQERTRVTGRNIVSEYNIED